MNEVPPLRDTSLPQGALKPLDGLSSELILAPVDVEGHSELLLNEAPQRATWHESQGSARAFEGKDPSGEEYPLNLLDLYFEDAMVLEPNIALQEPQRLIFNEGACARLNPSPGLGTVTTYLDVCKTASVLLEGEQNKLPSVGSKQYAAAQMPPHPFSFSPFVPPLLETVTCSTAPGKGVTLVPRATPYLEVLKPPDWNVPPLEEPGGVPLGLIHVAEKAGVEAMAHAAANMCEPGGASLDADGIPAPTKGTASIEPASGAVKATTTRPKVLGPRAENMAWSKLQPPPLTLPPLSP